MTDAVVVRLGPAPSSEPSDLAPALTTRQCTCTAYDGRPRHRAQLAALQDAGTASHVTCDIRTDRADLDAIAALVEANRAQLDDQDSAPSS